MSDAFPTELTVTVTLEDLGKQTKMRTTFSGMPEGPEKEMTATNFNESLNKLTNSVTKQVRLTIDRDLQFYVPQRLMQVYSELGAEWATAVVMRVSDGKSLMPDGTWA